MENFWIGLTDSEAHAVQARAILKQHPGVFGFLPPAAFKKSLENRCLVVGLRRGAVCGFIRFHDRRDRIRKIYEVAVARALLRLGLGSHMLRFVICDARARSMLSVELKAPEPGCGTHRFYRSLGFVLTKSEPGRVRSLTCWRLNIMANSDEPLRYIDALC
jgi:GNAT superfamily N-acetyltransferase